MGRLNKCKSLRRRKPRRDGQRVLIVCEGAKTEPGYFEEIRSAWRLSGANITITGKCNEDPLSVANHAIDKFNDDGGYDAVFCVFDRDQYGADFYRACSLIEGKKLRKRGEKGKQAHVRFQAITSLPCFEYWILLHYRYTTADFANCAQVVRELKKQPQHKHYTKGGKGLFALTCDKLEVAMDNARRSNQCAQANQTDSPATAVPDLIDALLELKKEAGS